MNDKFIDTSATLYYMWKDDGLAWNPDDGIEEVSVSADEVWTPDFGLLLSPGPGLTTFNSIFKLADTNGLLANLTVRFDGSGRYLSSRLVIQKSQSLGGHQQN